MEQSSRIFIAGSSGLVGSAIRRHLQSQDFKNLALPRHSQLDLADREAVRMFFRAERPEYVFMAAARVGGILANSQYPAEFIFENLTMATNVIHEAFASGVKKLLFLGSSCIYPRKAPQPIQESHLLSGELEPTNEAYAIAKIAGIKMCQAYRQQYGFDAISLMPTNLYGPNDNFDLQTSHVLPALVRRFHEAKVGNAPAVSVWGSGNVRREFLHVDDLANAALFLMQTYSSPDIVNVGTGQDLTIRELSSRIGEVTGFRGEVRFDPSKPDGMPRKLLDISRLRSLGWNPRIGLDEGLRDTYRWYQENEEFARRLS